MMLSREDIKKNLGRYAADLIPAGTTIGLGSGTTIAWLIKELELRAQQGFSLTIVPTSRQTQKLAAEAGITIAELNDVDHLPFTIDGADEIDPQFHLIKGGGGALLQEKMVAAASDKLIIIADEKKYADRLGSFPLPVEVIPSGWKQVQRKIESLGCKKIVLRQKEGDTFITDNGHYILDCHFEAIQNPADLNIRLHLIPGVVETGLFIDMATTVIIGFPDGSIEIKEK